MKSVKGVYREACSQSHRILGTYLALWAWRKRVDCVALHRHVWGQYLDVEAMRDKRLRWLAEDIRDIFPYQEALKTEGTAGRGTLYLSRIRFPASGFEDEMYDTDRIEHLASLGLRAALIARLPNKKRMVAALATVSLPGASFPTGA